MTSDDGVDRGIVFIFMGSDIARQFEFVKGRWTNDGDFIGLGAERDPLVGVQKLDSTFTIPRHPVRRRLRAIPILFERAAEICSCPACPRSIGWPMARTPPPDRSAASSGAPAA